MSQDTLTRARSVALRILQHTVYQMVEQIPQVSPGGGTSQCATTAVEGLRKELDTLEAEVEHTL